MKLLRIWTGPVHSGKSKRALNIAKRRLSRGHDLVVVRPAAARRAHEPPNVIVTKDGETWPCFDLKHPSEMLVAAKACTDFWLDEPALFPKDELLVFSLIQKIRKHASVLISGCSQTSELQVFRSSMSMLMAVADHIEVCKADCDDCGREEGATRSWALRPKSSQVRVGGKESYIALCRKCWTKRSEARARTGILIA